MAAFSFTSPHRMLDNIKRMEEAELPSLPSIQPNFDYDSAVETSQSSIGEDEVYGRGTGQADPLATPHPYRRPGSSLAASTARPDTSSTSLDEASSTSSAPFPPLKRSGSASSSPYIPARASTSTPFSVHSLHSRSRRLVSDDNNDTRSTARHLGHSRNRSDPHTGEYSNPDTNGENTRREQWHTPGEMSESFSGDEISPEDELPSLPGMGGLGLGSERSIPMKDVTDSSIDSLPAETPLMRRFSNVTMHRPGRRSQSLLKHDAVPSPLHRLPTPISESPSSVAGVHGTEQDRVPSLTKSEASAPDTSGAASTPEAPSRQVHISAASPFSPPRAVNDYEDLSAGRADAPTYEYDNSAMSRDHVYDETPAPRRRGSPAKMMADTPVAPLYATPGQGRDPAQTIEDVGSGYKGGNPLSVLRDLTNRMGGAPPFTPSPVGMMSKTSDMSTPRAPLDDAERRKNHVLAVLNSSVHSRKVRTPHPLRRASMSPSAQTIQEEGTPIGHTHAHSHSRNPFTPTNADFFDRSSSAPPNESFVSIASSADLTTDRRATTQPARFSRGNTSFPNLLMPSHGANVSASGQSSVRASAPDRRADAAKIHKHLNAMNRQLLETNAGLAREAEAWRDEVARLMGLLHGAGVEVEEVDVVGNVARSRDASFALNQSTKGEGDSARDEASKDEEQAVMQELVDRLESLEGILDGKDERIAGLQEEVTTLRESGASGSGGSSEELAQLREEVEEAERQRAELHADFAARTEQHAAQFSEICATYESQVGALKAELNAVQGEVTRLGMEKERLETALSAGAGEGAREELEVLREQKQAAEHEGRRLAEEVAGLEARLDRAKGEHEEVVLRAETAGARVGELEQQLDQVEEELGGRQGEIEALLDEKANLEDEVDALRSAADGRGLDGDEQRVAELQAKIDQLEADLDAQPDAHGLEQEVEQLREDVDELNRLLEARDAELEGVQGRLELAELAAQPMRQSIASPQRPGSASISATSVGKDEQASYVAAIEERLDEAYREIGRLKHELASTPHRKSSIEAKDARIKALEREKGALQERLVRGPSASPVALASGTPAGVLAAASPFGRPTPLFKKALGHLRTPKTPGSLRELSWMQTTVADANEPILRAQVEQLQQELEHANGQLDGNFSRLEEAGMNAVRLAEKLAAAHTRIGELEDEIRALMQRNKASIAMVHAQREENVRVDDERIKAGMAVVHTQLDALRAEHALERARMQSDQTRLRAALDELRATSEAEIERMHGETEDLLDAAHEDVEQAKKDAIAATRETADVRKELEAVQRNVERLEREVRRGEDEMQVQLRRAAAAAPREGQAEELARAREDVGRLQGELRAARDAQSALKAKVVHGEKELVGARDEVREMREERRRVMREIEAFERDLRAQSVEAARLREQLMRLREQGQAQMQARAGTTVDADEMKRVQRERDAVRDELRRVGVEMERCMSELDDMREWKARHACGGDTALALDDQRARLKVQTRDLAAQIKYLKAKYTRESTFRNGLALQKRYLLLLVGGMSLNEQATLRAIAQMGFPAPEPPRPKRTFKAVGLAVLGLVRARNAAAMWRAECETKAEAAAHFAERRRASGRA